MNRIDTMNQIKALWRVFIAVAMKKRFIIKITPQQALESPAAQQALVAGINFETSWGQLGVLMSVLSAGMTYVVDLPGGTQIKFSLGP